ncbi:MAG: haloalkane dehalogenase [Gammaproteobacteria bacterium]|nr:haloalkane dehalogenase [Gammaproteobacteria bacterium]MCP5198432.1 haloalkane dehalogenase [Gammaproteobacteria bacterium]
MNDWSNKKQYVEVEGRRMAYVEMGQGRPIVFQHGNPTSSYLWRNILPQLADLGRCIAIDLIGMGDSDKLPDSGPERYTFAEQRRYWQGALAALGVERDVVFVIHDWGSALGFDWIATHPGAAAAVAHMEGIVKPLSWDEWPDSAREMFQTFRSPAGETVVLEKNVFVERVLPASILRTLSDEEMAAYRAPFLEPGEGRRPTLTWPRQIPLGGEPADVVDVVENYADYLAQSSIPKLFISADPGMIMNGPPAEVARAWPNTTEVTVKGLHFIQEDSPAEIVAALRDWIAAFSGA